jgi:uncharacterized damage-inducible protein DinB
MAIKKTPAKPVKKAVAVKKTTVKKVNTTTIKKETTKVEVINPNIYPIGKFTPPAEFTEEVITKLIQDIRILPEHLKKVSKKIKKNKQLQYSYRDGGWSIEQIIHHIADSHMNAFVRYKLALTENNPTIKAYDENLWSETADIQLPIKTSIKLLKALHTKWTVLLENMDKNDFKRTYFHPGYNTTSSLQQVLALYAWHGKHHVAQIEVALKLN